MFGLGFAYGAVAMALCVAAALIYKDATAPKMTPQKPSAPVTTTTLLNVPPGVRQVWITTTTGGGSGGGLSDLPPPAPHAKP